MSLVVPVSKPQCGNMRWAQIVPELDRNSSCTHGIQSSHKTTWQGYLLWRGNIWKYTLAAEGREWDVWLFQFFVLNFYWCWPCPTAERNGCRFINSADDQMVWIHGSCSGIMWLMPRQCVCRESTTAWQSRWCEKRSPARSLSPSPNSLGLKLTKFRLDFKPQTQNKRLDHYGCCELRARDNSCEYIKCPLRLESGLYCCTCVF